MLIEIGIEAFISLFMGTVVNLAIGIGICGAEGPGMGSAFDQQHFLQMRTKTKNIVSVIRIMAAAEVKVQ